MVSTAIFFFDGIVIFAFYAKLNTRLAGLLTFVLLLVTWLPTLLLSLFSTGYLRPKRPYALSLIIIVLILFLGLVLYGLYAVFGQTIDLTQGLGVLTALFAVITGLVGTYFGVKASSDARERAQQVAAAATDTTLPLVSSVNPQPGAEHVPPDTHVTATFSKDIDRATINASTFKLIKGDTLTIVDGAVAYDPSTMTAVFSPVADLTNGSTHLATITTDVKDLAGNALAQDYTWHFTVKP
jgi:Bacterial Ig-like domain